MCDRVRRIVEFLLILACLSFRASAQTTDACRAQLQHLTLPSSARIDDGNAETPVEFLFSDHGADIYSAIPSSEKKPYVLIRLDRLTGAVHAFN